MKNVIVTIAMVLISVSSYAVKYDYLKLTSNTKGKVVVYDNNQEYVYTDSIGNTYNFEKQMDLVLEQLQDKGYEYVDNYTYGPLNTLFILRKPIE